MYARQRIFAKIASAPENLRAYWRRMKTILLLCILSVGAFAADITPLITSAQWKWDHPNAKGRVLKIRPDGTCESTLWKGVWKKTGEREITITQNAKQTRITFSEDWTSFEGVHHDGERIAGKRQGDVPPGLR